jgi:hypothetical protein
MVGYLEELKMFEFIGYRAGTMTLPPPKGNFKEHYVRIKRLFEEIDLHVPAECHAKKEPFVCIPLGRFLNWRYGLRGRIPIGITIQRWKNIIQDAILNNKVVHLYTHPHNFITGNNMYFLLDKILEYIQLTQKKEGLVNLTQQEYVELIRKNDGNM